MASREWTKAQKEAIRARNRNILVSAAAGSGKTSVMIERVIELLRAGGTLERMLIITFTRAAAGEMRERLTSELARLARTDVRLREEYDLIGRAQISTLHSYCSRLLARHFAAIGADPLTKTGQEVVTARLFERALGDVMEDLYKQPDEDARLLIERFSDEQIQDMVRALYRFLMAQADPFGWLGSALNVPATKEALKASPLYAILKDSARLKLEGALQYAGAAESEAMRPDGPQRYLPNCEEDRAAALLSLETLEKGQPLTFLKPFRATALRRTKAPDTESEESRERFKKLRNSYKACMTEAGKLLPVSEDELLQCAQDVALTLPPLRALGEMTRRLDARYGQLKAAQALRDYNDLEHMALKALSVPAVAKEASRQFDAIFVDEYQDISRTQEAIIAALHQDNDLFMVGDVKQSIYRFRLADPTLFLDKFKRFSSDEGADSRRILLNENFRSRPNILKAVNEVFALAMRERVTELDYGEDAQLNAGTRPGAAQSEGAPVTLLLVTREDDPSLDVPLESDEEEGEIPSAAAALEAAAIARRIEALHTGSEKVPYRDMVILLRSAASRAEVIAETLKQYGIPVYNDADAQYYELPEIRDTLNILHVLDNPLDDIALLSVLRCPVFGFSNTEISDIRKKSGTQVPCWQAFLNLKDEDPRIADALSRLDTWRFMAQHQPFDLFLRTLIDQSGLYARAGALPGSERRRANLLSLAARAKGSPKPWTLRTFNRLIDDARQRSRETAALGEHDEVVRIMTIHKSKGLEFPVVFVAGLAQRFRFDDGSALLKTDNALGLSLPLIDPQKRTMRETIAARAIKEKKERETRAEEARLLYVAMTRARDRLFLCGTPRNLASAMDGWRMPPGDFSVGSAKSMLDWVGTCVYEGLTEGAERLFTGSQGACWHILPIPASSLVLPKAPPFIYAPPPEAQAAETVFARLKKRPAPDQPAKTSVTALVRRARQEEEETPQTKRTPPRIELAPLPRLNEQTRLTAARRGTLTHKALCTISLTQLSGLTADALLPNVQTLLDQMTAQGILTHQERLAVDDGMIARFFAHPLGQRMLASPRILREQPFTLRAENGALVQGVLDCCFLEDGGWVLTDYKTDREASALIERYRDQMRWYMRALRTLTGLPVKEAWLFALKTGEAFLVTEDAPITLKAYSESESRETTQAENQP